MNKITIEIDVRQTEKKETNPTCRCKTPCSGNELQQAGEILMKLACGEYEPNQVEGAVEVIGALMQRYYAKNQKAKERV